MILILKKFWFEGSYSSSREEKKIVNYELAENLPTNLEVFLSTRFSVVDMIQTHAIIECYLFLFFNSNFWITIERIVSLEHISIKKKRRVEEKLNTK